MKRQNRKRVLLYFKGVSYNPWREKLNMETQYYRCKKCGHIFEETEECPICGEKADKMVHEDVNAEPVFNLND